MKRLLVLGAGTSGTMIVNKLRHRLNVDEWQITVVDRDDSNHFEPGYLLLPFGQYTADPITRARHDIVPEGVDFVIGDIDRVDAEANSVRLSDGKSLPYDYLVIASGVTPRPDQTLGMLDGEWRRSIFDFYSFEGAQALAHALAAFGGGRFVVHITNMPIKCPAAPFEFTFLAEAYFRERGIRDRVEMVYVTPLPGAFTKAIPSARLGTMLDERRVAVETDFLIERIDAEAKTLISYDEREIPFDLLVTVPLIMGAEFVARSGLGDELNYVPVDKRTMLSRKYPNIFAVGDASTSLPRKQAPIAAGAPVHGRQAHRELPAPHAVNHARRTTDPRRRRGIPH